MLPTAGLVVSLGLTFADSFFVGSRPAANIAAFTFPVWVAWSLVVVCEAAPMMFRDPTIRTLGAYFKLLVGALPFLMATAIVLWVTIGR